MSKPDHKQNLLDETIRLRVKNCHIRFYYTALKTMNSIEAFEMWTVDLMHTMDRTLHATNEEILRTGYD